MRGLLAAIGLTLAAASAHAQPYDLQWWTVDSGGSMGVTGAQYVLDATLGQPDAGGPMAAGGYVMHSGFWAFASSGAIGPQADLSVTVTDGAPTAVPGTTVTYTIVASNAGPAPVVGATVTDTPPAALTSVSWTCAASPGSSCPASGNGPLSASVSLLVGGTATIALTGTIDPAATGALANAASVVTPNGVTDPGAANNLATDTDTLVPTADLALTLTDAPDPVAAGAVLTYTVQVANAGPSRSASATVTDTLPAAVGFVSASPGCTPSANVVTCVLGAIAPGGATSLTIQVQVAPGATGLLSDAASVSGSATDPVGANDADVETTQVSAARAKAELVHGTRLRATLAANGPVADADLYRVRQQPNASYEVVVDATSGDVGVGQGPIVERVGPDGVTVVQSSEPVGSGPSRSLRFANTTTAAVDGDFVRVRSGSCGTDCGPDDVYELRAWETTARIPRFNNSATQISVVLLQNRAARAVQGQMSFWSTTGVRLLVVPVDLPPRASAAYNTSALGLAGQSGSVTIAHDGAYDALTGKAVALESITGLAFDSGLESIPR